MRLDKLVLPLFMMVALSATAQEPSLTVDPKSFVSLPSQTAKKDESKFVQSVRTRALEHSARSPRIRDMDYRHVFADWRKVHLYGAEPLVPFTEYERAGEHMMSDIFSDVTLDMFPKLQAWVTRKEEEVNTFIDEKLSVKNDWYSLTTVFHLSEEAGARLSFPRFPFVSIETCFDRSRIGYTFSSSRAIFDWAVEYDYNRGLGVLVRARINIGS